MKNPLGVLNMVDMNFPILSGFNVKLDGERKLRTFANPKNIVT